MKTMTLLTLVVALAAAAPANAAGILDGKTFSGLTGPKGKTMDSKDDLVFRDGKLHSTACDAYGFTPGPYTAVQRGAVTTFTATTKSSSDGTIEWQGTIRDGRLDGTFVWKKALIFRRTYSVQATQQ